MQIKSLIIGIFIGALLGVGAMFIFGDQIQGRVADTTVEMGETVRDAGNALERQGKKLK